MILFHGEDISQSRTALLEAKKAAVQHGGEVVIVSGKEVSLTDLRQACEAMNLLGTGRTVVIEGLLSAPKSKRQEEIIAYLKETKPDQVLLWEGKKIPVIRIKSLGAVPQEYTLPKILFTWLESVRPGNTGPSLKLLKMLLATQPAELVLFMLARQVRQLVMARFEPGLLTCPSWLAGKLKAQAGKFSPEQLLTLHRNLYLVDGETKTGKSLLPLAERLAGLVLTV